jgi:hypothetical protein
MRYLGFHGNETGRETDPHHQGDAMNADSIATFRIDPVADLADMWGGQTDFEVAVYMTVDGETDIIGAGHTVRQAVREARAQMYEWRVNAARVAIGLAPDVEPWWVAR